MLSTIIHFAPPCRRSLPNMEPWSALWQPACRLSVSAGLSCYYFLSRFGADNQWTGRMHIGPKIHQASGKGLVENHNKKDCRQWCVTWPVKFSGMPKVQLPPATCIVFPPSMYSDRSQEVCRRDVTRKDAQAPFSKHAIRILLRRIRPDWEW